MKLCSRTFYQIKLEAKTGSFRGTYIETSLRRPSDNKKTSNVDPNCNMTKISLQGDHRISTIFWILEGSTLQVRIRVLENPVAVIPIPITIQTEKFTNLFVIQNISKILDKGENQSMDDLVNFIKTNHRALHEVSHINILHALVDLNVSEAQILD